MVGGETLLNSANVSGYICFQLLQINTGGGHDDAGIVIIGKGQKEMFEGDFYMLLGLGIVGSARERAGQCR